MQRNKYLFNYMHYGFNALLIHLDSNIIFTIWLN